MQLYCDHEAAVAVLNAGYSHDPLIMHLLRSLFFVKAYFDLDLRVVYIPGKENVIAHAISHNDLATLHSQLPPISPSPTPVPPRVTEMDGQPDWTSVDWVKLFTSCLLED